MKETSFQTGLHYPIKLEHLPKYWCFGYVGEFAEQIESGFACGAHNQCGDGVQHLRPMNITSDGKISLSDARHVPSDYNSRRLRQNDILFNNTNSPQLVGKTAFIGTSAAGKAFSNHMTRIAFCDATEARFAARQLHYLYSSGYFLHRCVKHVNQASVSSSELGKTVPLVMPPLNEQKRIVAKIEELFSELDAGEESLRKARRQLGVYRQALLKQAFEGKLTAAWRKQNPHLLESPDQLLARIQAERESRYKRQVQKWKAALVEWEWMGNKGKPPAKPKKPRRAETLSTEETSALSKLPHGWSWCLFGTVCEFANGDRGKNYPHRSEYVAEGVPWINTGHIQPDGSLSPDRMHFITREKFESLSGGRIQVGDLVYCLRGATFGKTAFVKPYKEGAIASSLMIIRPVIPEACELIYHFLLSPLGKSQLQRFDNGSAQPNLSADSVRLYEFPLCSLPEQQEIVRILDEQFTVIEQNEREIDAALKRSEALRQSILKKAFSGQLVAQDPADEPASVLLERIRAERETSKASPRKVAQRRPSGTGRLVSAKTP